MKRAIYIAKRLTASFFSITAVIIFLYGLFTLDLERIIVSVVWLFIGGGFGVSIVSAFEELYNDGWGESK